MGCLVDLSFRRQYPDTVTSIFMSVTGGTIPATIDGWLGELRKLGDATSAPAVRRLAPVGSLTNILNSQKAFLEKAEFFAIDTTLDGATEQDADVLSLIYGSRATKDIYPQSQFRNGAMPLIFQPNWFRPVILINGIPLIKGLETAGVAESGIGLPVPVCFELNSELEMVKDIQITASFAQKVDTKYQNYPVMAVLTFWTGLGTKH